MKSAQRSQRKSWSKTNDDCAAVAATDSFGQMTHTISRVIPGLLVILVLLSGVVSADTSEKKMAMLVEAYSTPRCHGLDCPPWPTPPDTNFCFQVGASYYIGISRPWGVPWDNKAKRLLALQGQFVEITLAEKHIRVMTSGIKLTLLRAYDHPAGFKIPACARA
jgi:hypothetical protein